MELRNFFKKNNSKNTLKNGSDFEKKNNKFLKVFGCLALATFMSATALFATAPFGTGAANASTNTNLSNTTQTTTNNGLITPKEDDPVLFKTKSGIEIKWGKLNSSFQIPILSGYVTKNEGLKGFPYFSSFDASIQYDWIIIGQSSISPVFEVPENDPAGIIIQQECFHAIRATEEIPENSVLCLSNNILANGSAVSSGYTHSYGGSSKWYVHSDYRAPLLTTMDGYYTDSSWGIEPIKDYIMPVSLSTKGTVHSEHWSASPATSTQTVTLENKYIFPLASSTYEDNSFRWSTYLMDTEFLLSDVQWLRDGSGESKFVFNNTGQSSLKSNSSAGYRPAFCLKVL